MFRMQCKAGEQEQFTLYPKQDKQLNVTQRNKESDIFKQAGDLTFCIYFACCQQVTIPVGQAGLQSQPEWHRVRAQRRQHSL